MPDRTIYFDDTEHAAIGRCVREEDASVSSIVRVSVRLFLGLPVPRWARELHAQLERERMTA